ncbi:MAG: helix-turn-helix transcriptional regulator [Bacteroidales bacterium]|nr:helix-turn-helix transcriptional regulator [Bacteroidales bacterium]
MQKHHYPIILLLLFNLSGYSQYSISGYISTKEKNKTVYLSLLRYNEEVAIYPGQVLISTETDSSGYFEITGKLLPNKNKLYRIHSNLKESATGLEFIENGEDKNYHNFIFSNIDTIYFPKGNDVWFSHPQNTNSDDTQWQKSIKYELTLIEEYSKTQNADAIIQAEKSFLDEFKLFCSDSLSDPLVKLLAYSHIKRNVSGLSQDFKSNPDFYYDLSEELNKNYSGTSYYAQFQEEISKLSASIIQQKYLFHKRLNYLFSAIIITILAIILLLFRKLRMKSKKEYITEVSTLTAQEEKITKLICDGMSNKEIASSLFISHSTVKSHIRSLYLKMDVANRQQLVEKLQIHTRD